jgi:hypothetical protein
VHVLTFRHIMPFVVGIVVSVSVHMANGWWLNSGRGVALMLALLAAAATIVVRLLGAAPTQPAGSLWAGSFLGMVATLVWSGAGTIWPIVLVVGGALSAAAVALGAVAGGALGAAGKPRQ